jgi:hypothetical protein
VVSYAGSWLSGVEGAQFGLMLPGKIVKRIGSCRSGLRSKAPPDRSEVLEVGVTRRTPAGVFENCVHLQGSSARERGGDPKWYAPGVGLMRDGKGVLVKIERGGI